MSKERFATPSNSTDPSNLFAFEQWLAGRNLTRTTGYRYRRAGLLKTIDIFGRLYITRDEIEKFEERAINGDFHKEVKPPVGTTSAAAGRRDSLRSACARPEGRGHE